MKTSCIHKIDVGTPPSSLSKDNDNEWEMIEVRYHGFQDLTVVRGEVVVSPEFTCFGHQWRLRVYPGGHTSSGDGMVGAFLENMSNNRSIKIQFGFAVKNKGKTTGWSGYLSKKEGNEFAASGTTVVAEQIFDSWGTHNFCKRTQIIDALIDGTSIVEVRMRTIGETTTSLFIPENPFVNTLMNMFNDEESADVVFEVENEKVDTTGHKRAKTTTSFHAHRNILQKCCSSALLGELCKSGGEGVVSITDVTPEIFNHLLYYVYGGKVSDEDLKNNAKETIDAADKYGLVNLKLEAEASLVKSTTITFDNAIDNLLYADSKNCALLQEAVLDFVAKNQKEASTKLSFGNVPGHVIPHLLAATSREDIGNSSTSSSADANDFGTMRINTMRKMLHEKGLDIDGSRETMIARLEENA